MRRVGAAVVGAGFSGLIVSRELAKVDKVTLFEEHENGIGLPKHCTGIVSRKVVELIGKVAEENLEGYLDEFFMGLPDGRGMWIKGPKKFTAKLERVGLERGLFEEVLSEGVKVEWKVVREVKKNGEVDGERFERVIIAEGWRAELSSALGISHRARRVYGVNLEVKGKTAFPGSVEVWFDKELAPGFFAWVVMLEGKAVVGTASEPKRANVRELAKKVLERARERGLVEGKVVEEYGGVILTGPPTLTPCYSKVCSIGDAAGMNKPLTGGGLYPSSVVATRFPSVFPKVHKAYHPLLERLAVETVIARIAHKAPQRTYERFFSAVNGEEVYVSEYDNHLRTIREMGLSKGLKLFALGLRSLLP